LQCKCVPFCSHHLLMDTEVSPINCHETVIEDIPRFLTVEVNLQLKGWRGAGV
jgi:hypothetical protein